MGGIRKNGLKNGITSSGQYLSINMKCKWTVMISQLHPMCREKDFKGMQALHMNSFPMLLQNGDNT